MPHTPSIQYIWFGGSLILLLIWFFIYLILKNNESKIEMLKMSIFTSFFGITEPLFVPRYWHPPSLFDLANRTGFDIESFIFCFAVGGLAVAIYELIFKPHHLAISIKEQHCPRHRFHFWIISTAPIIFIAELLFTALNPIYAFIIAGMIGGILTMYCRPDLISKMIGSAFIFLTFYFVFFLILVNLFPGYVEQVWNLNTISGILILGVPLEELLFAFTFGFYWSSLYEHFFWKKLQKQ